MSEENGTVYVLPYSRAGTRTLVEHVRDERANDLIGYRGDDAGIPVIVPAGSIAVFTGFTFHRSGANRTNRLRRVYLSQYTPEPARYRESGEAFGRNELFIKAGQRVYNGHIHEAATASP